MSIISRAIGYFYIINICLSVLCAGYTKNGKEIPCRLTWEEVDSLPGSDIPSAVIRVEENSQQVVIRAKKDNSAIVGRYDESSEEGPMIPIINSYEEIPQVYFILTNPEGCTVEWATVPRSGAFPEFAVRADEFSSVTTTFVGRKHEEKWLPGHVDTKDGILYVRMSQDETSEFGLGDFQVLTSFSGGLEMEVVDVKLVPEPLNGNADFMGVDNIINNGPGEVAVTIEHRKTVKETYSITIKETHTTTKTKIVTVKILFFKVEKKSVNTVTTTTETTYTEEEETEFKVTQKVTVPAYTSVQACSTIKMTEKTDVNYTAAVRYIAIGRTPEEIRQLLLKDKITAEIRSDGVYHSKRMEGYFKADVALLTTFNVFPLDSDQSCGTPVENTYSV